MFHHVICEEEFSKRINYNYINFYTFYGSKETPVNPNYIDFLQRQLNISILADTVASSSTLIGLLTSMGMRDNIYCDTLAVLVELSILSMYQSLPNFLKISYGYNYKLNNKKIYEQNYDQKNLAYNDLLHTIILYKIILANTNYNYLNKLGFFDRLNIFFKLYEVFSLLFPYKLFYSIKHYISICQYQFAVNSNYLVYDIPSYFSFLLGVYNISNRKDTKDTKKDIILNEIKYKAIEYNIDKYIEKIEQNLNIINSLYQGNYILNYEDFFPRKIWKKILYDKINIDVNKLFNIKENVNNLNNRKIYYMTITEDIQAKFFKENINQEIYSYFNYNYQDFNSIFIDTLFLNQNRYDYKKEQKYLFASAHLGYFNRGYLTDRFKKYFSNSIYRYENLINQITDKNIKQIKELSIYDILSEQKYNFI